MRAARLLLSAGVFGGSLAAVLLAGVGDPTAARLSAQLKAAQPTPPVAADAKKDDKKKPVDPAEADRKVVTAAGLKPDDAADLTKYLKSRTPSATDRTKIDELIKKMGGEVPFDERVAAQDELMKIGGPAVSVLRRVAIDTDLDPEIAFRAKEAVRRMEQEKSLGADVTVAVIRTLGRSKDPQAAPTLIGFLPLADTSAVTDAIQFALRDAAAPGPDGKAPKLLADALSDPSANVRRVCALALLDGGTPEKPVRFPDVLPKLTDLAKTDADAGVRFAIARSLLAEAKEKAAVPVLIDLLPDLTRGQSWQAEELLVKAAGKDAPKERCRHTPDRNTPGKELSSNKKQREGVRDAWKKWWDGAADKTDLTKADVKQTIRGHFIFGTQFWGAGQQVLVTEFGPDDKERARISFAINNSIMDLAMDDAGRLFTLEYGIAAVNVRDASGKVTTTWTVPMEKNAQQRVGFQPKGLQMRENGNLLVVHSCGVAELDKDGKEVFKYTRPAVGQQPQQDVMGATRMRNGELVLSLNTGRVLTLDEKGKEVEGKKGFQAGAMNQKSLIAQTGDDKVLLAEQQQIIEYNLKTGKAEGVKFQNVYNTMSLQRLPNGNILYADTSTYPYRVVEKTAANEEVWSMQMRDTNQNIVRATVR
jgi:HEAT repeat protein